ncbi:MAG: ABC transporter permease [Thermoanaerobaculia bacterium]|nr:MAG: ABC transporter permease [Thermoanaerobaculia bacterium]MBZ0103570.1 ABC transporter permease [Thermoanaerobaculia bacterium]
MIRLVLRRLLLAVPTTLAVATLVFSLIHLIPGDPVLIMLGEGAQPTDVEQLRSRLGLDRPLAEQYVRFVGGLVRGDLGQSLHFGEPVSRLIARHYPATVELALAAMLVALAVALPLGMLAAFHRGGWIDRGARFFALAGVSLPNFWLGPVAILLFSIQLGWLPVSGRGTLAHLVLPAATLGLALAGLLTRMVRSALGEELGKPYLVTARAKGLSPARVAFAHALRNALVPVVTVVGLQFGSLLTGAILTETIFGWPGIGRLLIQAIRLRDYPLVQGAVLLIAVTYVLVNLVTDLVYARIDPRIRVR